MMLPGTLCGGISVPAKTTNRTASKCLDLMIAAVFAYFSFVPSGRKSTISPGFACCNATACFPCDRRYSEFLFKKVVKK